MATQTSLIMSPTTESFLRFIRPVMLMMGLSVPALCAQTVNWASPVFSEIRDSNGISITSGFSAELGVFANSFVPTAENVGEWAMNWRTVDVADFDESLGYLTGTFDIYDDGRSSSPDADPGVFFSLPAYVWIYDTPDLTNGAEWFLARSDEWVLPDEEGDCCGGTPTEWSTSDFGNEDEPVVGAHGNVRGGGTAAAPGFYDLQTYTVVPEPGSLTLLAMAAGLCLRRRRVCQ